MTIVLLCTRSRKGLTLLLYFLASAAVGRPECMLSQYIAKAVVGRASRCCTCQEKAPASEAAFACAENSVPAESSLLILQEPRLLIDASCARW